MTVFIGVPTYEEGRFWGFHPWAENVRSGVRGVRKARVSDRGSAKPVGVALFAEWTTSTDDWSVYQGGWVRDGQGAGR